MTGTEGGEDLQLLPDRTGLSEMDVVHNGADVWSYSSNSNSVTHNTMKSDSAQAPEQDATAPVNPDKVAQQALAKIDPSTAVTVDRTARVAGRPAYQLELRPRDPNTSAMYQPQMKLSTSPRTKLRQVRSSNPGKKIESAAC